MDTPTMTERCEECGIAVHLPNDPCDDCAMSTTGEAGDTEMWEFVYGEDAR